MRKATIISPCSPPEQLIPVSTGRFAVAACCDPQYLTNNEQYCESYIDHNFVYTMSQLHPTERIRKENGGNPSIQSVLKKWRGIFKSRTLSSQYPPAPTSTLSYPTAKVTIPSSQSSQSSEMNRDYPALFKPTTHTIIHSPMDKRNRSFNASSLVSLSRRPTLSSRRFTAPAGYFADGLRPTKRPLTSTVEDSAATDVDRATGSSSSPSSSRIRFSMKAGS